MSAINPTDDKTSDDARIHRGYIRRHLLPDDIIDAAPRTLHILCDAGWSLTDIAEQFDEGRHTVKRRLNVIGATPDCSKSPWLHGDNGDSDSSTAAYLWRHDPEDVGLTSEPADWNHISTYKHSEASPQSHTLADYGGGRQ